MVPTLDFLGQSFYDEETTAAFVTKAAQDPAIDSLTMVVAWARFGGLRRIKPALQAFRARGGDIRIILGIDEGGATRPGLMLALDLANEAYVFHDPTGWTFHPKIYLAEGRDRATLLVGSSNATAGGLFGNYEASLEATFALPEENDHQALVKVRRYAGRLLAEDQICLPLTQGLIDSLVEDPRYAVAGRERRIGRARDVATGEAGEDVDASGSTPDEGSGAAIFGRRLAAKSMPPALTTEAREELSALEAASDDEIADEPGRVVDGGPSSAGEAPVAGTSVAGTDGGPRSRPADVVKRWYKRLSTGDAQQLDRRTSSGTAAATLVQFGHPIDRATYFRQDLFGALDWTPQEGQKESASVEFDVRIDGVPQGKRQLMIVYDPAFESNQGNRTTLLRWGVELSEHLRANDHAGDYLTLERLSDGSYRLTISQVEIGPFLA